MGGKGEDFAPRRKNGEEIVSAHLQLCSPMAGVHYLVEIQLTIYIISLSLGPGSAMGEKRSKTSASEASRPVVWGGKGWPFPPPQTTARLTSPADIFPLSPRFFWAFFRYCGALSQAKFPLMINST